MLSLLYVGCVEAVVQVGCVGDSITEGAFSSGGNHTYPGQLQIMLGDGYKVTNMGAGGATLLKKGNSPYWERPQYKTLTENKWDIVIIMLGTNDAKDLGNGNVANWPHNCTGPTGLECPFAQDFASMIDVVRTLGTTESGPVIYSAIPPPLMKAKTYGMNQTVINTIFPTLIPRINENNSLPHAAIDVFGFMGGDKQASFPVEGCTHNSTFPTCKYWCDAQSCDQCHPDDDGYNLLAQAVRKGLVL